MCACMLTFACVLLATLQLVGLIGVGAAVGAWVAKSIKITELPQMVSMVLLEQGSASNYRAGGTCWVALLSGWLGPSRSSCCPRW